MCQIRALFNNSISCDSSAAEQWCLRRPVVGEAAITSPPVELQAAGCGRKPRMRTAVIMAAVLAHFLTKPTISKYLNRTLGRSGFYDLLRWNTMSSLVVKA